MHKAIIHAIFGAVIALGAAASLRKKPNNHPLRLRAKPRKHRDT